MQNNKSLVKLGDNDQENLENYHNTPFIDYYVGHKNIDSKSFEISLLCECERIWITYDENQDGELDFDEIYHYILTSVPYLSMSRQ